MKKNLLLTIGILLLLSPLAAKLPPLAHRLDGPDFCGACHLMDSWVNTWSHSAHRDVATCGDCHLPHDLVRGAYYKAFVGVRDGVETVLGAWPTPIKLSNHGGVVTQENCYRCHQRLVWETNETSRGKERFCWNCHRNTPHSL